MGLILVGAIILATLMGVFSAYAMAGIEDGAESISQITSGMVGIFSFFGDMLIAMGAAYGILIYLSVRFYQSMYTDRGYLLHTLPVTKHQILVSKVFVGTVWVSIISLVMVLSSTLTLIFSVVLTLQDVSGVFEVFEIAAETIRDLWIATVGTDKEWIPIVIHYAEALLLMFLTGLPSQLLLIYGAISVGQLFKKYRVLWALLFVMLFGIVKVLLSYVAFIVIMVGGSVMFPDNDLLMVHMYAFMYDMSWIIGVVLAVVCYKVTHWILTRKLNMA